MGSRKDDVAEMLDLVASLLVSAAEETGTPIEKALPASAFFISLGRAFREDKIQFKNEVEFWRDVEDYSR